MANPAKILAFAGSTRTKSFNKQLVRIAAHGARAAGAEVTEIDLRDFPMPVYDGDFEEAEGLPEHARRLKGLMKIHDGYLIATPEYNSSISAVLKNTIDWTSRPSGDEPPLIGFKDKVVALMSASPGRLGGLRGIYAVRSILHNLGCIVLPEMQGIAFAIKAFDDEGALRDTDQQHAVEQLGKALATMIVRLKK